MPELMPAERHAGDSAGGQPSWPGTRQSELSRPFGEFEEILDRLVSRSHVTSARTADGRVPVADLAETADGWVVEVAFPPGIDTGQVETRLTGRVLTVRVPRPASKPTGQKLN